MNRENLEKAVRVESNLKSWEKALQDVAAGKAMFVTELTYVGNGSYRGPLGLPDHIREAITGMVIGYINANIKELTAELEAL